jgi:hypothetical protein
MKRRGFFGAVAAIVAAPFAPATKPSIVHRLPEPPIDPSLDKALSADWASYFNQYAAVEFGPPAFMKMENHLG